ncbi:helix-turn-helix transcriptional regulator [Streptomyces sp. NPDC021098]|uniref:helix-turn-helix transcriptional regulator n=1 Tax=unclassified Streptomyces TaxID=2593676 RepID=UPI0037872CA2
MSETIHTDQEDAAGTCLGILGVSAAEEALYRRLLRSGNGCMSATCLVSGEEVLADRLVELGVAVRGGLAGGVRAVGPARAVDQLIDDRLRRLRGELEATVAATGVVESLISEMAGSHSSPVDVPPVQQLKGVAAVREAIDELTFFARSENLTVNPIGVLTPESIEVSRPMDLRVLRRGLRMRTLMAAPALDDPVTMAYLRELAANGAEIRISYQPLERMIICDRSAALTPIDPSHTARGALLTRETGLVATLVALFDRMWVSAQELPLEDEDAPSETECSVLKVLYTADKDESGARDLGMSVRTYRKYVASLMDRLGASNRFQAALLAREKGWI